MNIAGRMKKRCFVVMGFGKRTDFQTGRTLDLDKVYRHMIRPAAERVGLECVRGDEHAMIDLTMFNDLLSADVVIADLSTGNLNAMYELGVRHALRKRTTVLIAEDQFRIPFDVSHVKFTTYKHHGEVLDVEEAAKLVSRLSKVLEDAMASEDSDSPVYSYLKLHPPVLDKDVIKVPRANGLIEEAFAALLANAWKLSNNGQFDKAESALLGLLALLDQEDARRTCVIQRLARVTYEGKRPSHRVALERAVQVLRELDPERSKDPDTLRLSGDIEKCLWEETGGRAHLAASLRAYERGFCIIREHQDAIKFAFMLDTRASVQTDPDERTADRVVARRVRREALVLVETALKELQKPTPLVDEAEEAVRRERLYWVLSTKAEAFIGLGKEAEASAVLAEARPFAKADWMLETTDTQLAKLRKLLASDKQS